MNVASLELCRTLFELSGWGEHYSMSWYVDDGYVFDVAQQSYYPITKWDYPAYDLGYLLRKLPCYLYQTTNELLLARWGSAWRACYMPINLGHYPNFREQADTPEDAAASLAIELFKQGVLATEAKQKK